MRDHLNAVVKERETFRPFAPVVPCEDLTQFFDVTGNCAAYHHMLLVTDVRPEYRDQLPGVTQVDGSARVQAVDRDHAPFLWALCKEHQRHTGIPVLINTSFNLAANPSCAPRPMRSRPGRGPRSTRVLGGILVIRPADR